ncbi:MAG: polysaccharide biosynthesis protein [Gordonia sp. (in: high G+C Gram-positive bacteria)]|uniref:polysaccharide biosynthesis protein n=1 Tax=Gordonia sp. (in: high G+C Gram-positive bacteria) TaxID=84139 RepID=UPI0039E3641A
MVANLLAYLVQLPASRLLGPAGYGEFAVLLSAMLVMAVPALALQSVVAREVVRGADRRGLWRLIAVVTGVVALASVGFAAAMMGIADTAAGPAFAAMAGAAPLAVIAGGQGLIQGDGRFGLLGGVLAGVGVLRSAPVIAAVVLGGGSTWALTAGTLGTAVAALGVGALAVRTPAVRSGAPAAAPSAVLWASGVQLVIIVAASLDLLLSRTVLSADDAGIYALGAVATKAAFWLPQAVGVVVYPRLADPVRSTAALRSASKVLAVIGIAVTLAAAAAGPLVPTVVSPDYRPVTGLLWLFALTGAVLAVLQLLLLAAIARDRARGGIPASLVLALEVVCILAYADSVLSLAVIAVLSALASVLVTWLWIELSDRS